MIILPQNANPLNPPPLTGNRPFDSWARELYRKLGQASIEAPIKPEAPNVIKNTTNDATADSIDAGTDATVRVYGSGGVGSNWTRYSNLIVVGTHSAVTFTGKAYSTRYYIGFDVRTSSWVISTAYKDVTGDYMIVFSVLTVAAGGAGGLSGGGAPASGGSGGIAAGESFSGRGFLL